ncbi:carbamoyltransferase HypF [Kibdelosporangium aridum]|uniref:Carbamoyltransferase n=1 Tax=Kibdelosporangium aridum TaxID=2030 RepID=A0A428ZAQ4_KIBAR|nr:carbamoyltransferase HypF [Kibdelosporangium aridum]RSM85139.1 carbamoyltransferase HypF [Kibdelosporangium aridum]
MDGTAELTVRGIVQGVGFRPFVYRLATTLGLAGDVRNDGGQVVIRLAGNRSSLDDFITRLRTHTPPHARVDEIDVHNGSHISGLGPGFAVLHSTDRSTGLRKIPADLATCQACLRELFDPADRRYRYPFLNCTACGPRATIIDSLPYDRANTAMRDFPLCSECEREYHDPGDRRFHAEPIACPACGPRLIWLPNGSIAEQALNAAIEVIAGGGIVALKGLGGYQLVCDANDENAIARLRSVKSRPRKAFAVMVPDLATARKLAEIDSASAAMLSAPAAPIMLLRPRANAAAASVAPGLPELGLFLPYTPLHHLLMTSLGRPLVVTSGNRGGEPIVIDDEQAVADLGPICDGILSHNREIRSRYDDSVTRGTTTIRRARGYAPAALPLPVPVSQPLAALGAQLKHTVSIAVGQHAIVGPHTGDLEDAATLDAFAAGLHRLCRLQNVDPTVCAHDLHPDYLSTQYAARWPEERRIPVQHHHAHVVATAAEHDLPEPFAGLAFDGLGMGDDGTFWGGEALVATYRDYRRVGRFATAPMPGGAAAVRHPIRMALGYLLGAEDCGGDPLDVAVAKDVLSRLPRRETNAIRIMIERQVNCPKASSAGRLFDAVAALLEFCEHSSYEGEAAILLEAASAGYPDGHPLPHRFHTIDGILVYDPVPTLRAILESCDQPGALAARFHTTISEVAVRLAAHACRMANTSRVCLGGGVFQNRRLTGQVMRRLTEQGYQAYVGEQVPVNDGGISYGQAAVAAARLATRS